MAIGYAVKHNRLPVESLLFYSRDTVPSEKDINVGAVDVDLAACLREGDDAFVAVVLPGLGFPIRANSIKDFTNAAVKSLQLFSFRRISV